MKPNLADRDVYTLNSTGGPFENEVEKLNASELKDKMSEKLKYILSNKDTYEPFEKQKKVKLSKQIIIPQKFVHYDRIQVFGGKIEDPFRTNILNPHEMEERVFTHPAHASKEFKKLDGVKQIEKTFDKVKNIKVGMTKPDSNGKVVAKKVYDLKPMFSALAHKVLHVLTDDGGALTENLPVAEYHPLGFS
jgi:hypothetical protein